MEIWRRRIVFCTLYLMDDCNEFLLWLLPKVLSNPSSTTMHVKWGRHICCLLSEGLVLFIYLSVPVNKNNTVFIISIYFFGC